MSLVIVLLFDFQQRKFVKRQRRSSEESLQDVITVEASLFRFRITLAASLARLRIKFNLVNIDRVLPEIVKERQRMARGLPLHGWVNTQKASLGDVRDALTNEGFSDVDSVQRLRGHAFCVDRHCGDLLVFSPDLRAELSKTELVKDCKLVIQDKSCSLPPNAMRSVLTQEQCVLMTGSFSALTVAHVAAIAASCSGTVLVCESKEAKRKELEDVLSKMECTNVDVIPRNFVDLDPMGAELENAAVVLMMPQCSLSAISNPVEFIVRENRDVDLLQDLSRGSVSQGRLSNLVACQKQELAHAIKIPKSSAIVYSTCSSFSEENEEVVRRVVRSKLHIYRLSDTGLPSDSTDKAGDKDLFWLEASTESNGVFVAVMTRLGTFQQGAPVVEQPAERSKSKPKPTAVKSPTAGPSSGKALSKKQQGKRKREKLRKASQASRSEPPPNRARKTREPPLP
ncbi:hypothetical protein AAFF_G00192210 [Aldrovandia affinis]|uniref:SAM-dependent MTase RsmB/NOP-type domain-containing protein n=1 Tax=Aldrovandia affinis TaxID=143900 RepID=A0AAD7W6G2_9TELE|nr:hypothetical protein AAFF_G00192210 [Aldrovandia affinis]